jgi:hypothetical protein
MFTDGRLNTAALLSARFLCLYVVSLSNFVSIFVSIVGSLVGSIVGILQLNVPSCVTIVLPLLVLVGPVVTPPIALQPSWPFILLTPF